jgi:hypothetical protein
MVEIISVHIPKTAGTAFRNILLEIYNPDEVFKFYNSSEKKIELFNQDTQTQIKAIHGHFKTSIFRQIFPGAKWIVWLRHPIFRLISQYFYQNTMKNKIKDEETNRILAQDLGILEFAKISSKQNIQLLYIDNMNLKDFYFVGIQEFFDEDIAELKQLMGWSHCKKNSRNNNPHPEYIMRLETILNDTKLMNQLALLNSKDMELYQTALELRAERRQESKWLQQTLADWNRSQFLLGETTQKLKQTQTELEQLRHQLKQSQPKITAVDVIQFPESEISDLILGWGMALPQPKAKLEADKIPVRGWVIAKNSRATEVIIICNNKILAQTPVNQHRPKLLQQNPHLLEAEYSGFETTIETTGMSLESELLIQVILEDQTKIALGKIKPIK